MLRKKKKNLNQKKKKKESKPKAPVKKKAPSSNIENAGTTNLGALLKAKLDDGK